MSDDLMLSGGGTTAVATDELLHAGALLSELSQNAAWWRDRLSAAMADGGESMPALATGIGDLAEAAEALGTIEDEAAQLAFLIGLGAEAYGAVERMSNSALEAVSATVATAVGFFMPGLVAVAVSAAGPLSAIAALATAIAAAHPSTAKRVDAAAQSAIRELTSTEPFALAVRAAVSSIDDLLLGLAGLPPAAAGAFGEQGAGVFDFSAVAPGIVAAAGAAGKLREGPVGIRAVGQRNGTAEPVWKSAEPPAGFEEIMERIPPSTEGEPQVRIERYVAEDGTVSWIVYTSGTIDQSFDPSAEPWDMTSNVNAVATGGSASVRATLAAMEAAGIQEGDRVLQVGYSQGGIVAAAIAATGRYDTTLLTFGAPVGQIVLPDSVVAVEVEHREDIMPSLGGFRRDSQATLVQRSLYDGGPPPPGTGAVPAHDPKAYAQTASYLDDSQDPRIVELRERLAGITAGEGSVARYRAQRGSS